MNPDPGMHLATNDLPRIAAKRQKRPIDESLFDTGPVADFEFMPGTACVRDLLWVRTLHSPSAALAGAVTSTHWGMQRKTTGIEGDTGDCLKKLRDLPWAFHKKSWSR